MPHPELFGSCDDLDVIGVCFYLMAPIDGFTPPGRPAYADDPTGRGTSRRRWRKAPRSSALIDHEAVGLGDFGKSENWLERQVGRWRSQLDGYRELEGYSGSELPHVDLVGQWLEDHRPAQCPDRDHPRRLPVRQHHVLQHRAKLAAIVDWELSTLGDPLLDLAWMLTAWHEPDDPPGHGSAAAVRSGTACRAARSVIEHYGKVSGRSVDDMPWFFVLACYKLGILLEGSYARALAGQAADGHGPHAPLDGHVAVPEGCTDDRRVIQRGADTSSQGARNRGAIVGIESFRYDGKRALVVGGATGMGAAAAQIVGDLGGEVVVMDYADVSFPVAKSIKVDLRNPADVDKALDEVGGPVHALFSCAGVADGTEGIMKINFIAHRHIIDRLINGGKMPSGSAIGLISSVAGLGWEKNLETLGDFLEHDRLRERRRSGSRRTRAPTTTSSASRRSTPTSGVRRSRS